MFLAPLLFLLVVVGCPPSKDGETGCVAEEVCNDLDDDCDGETDEAAIDAPVWFHDTDADGYGNAVEAMTSCDQPVGYVSTAGDCDDEDPEVPSSTPCGER